MKIEPKIRGFICTTAHPSGCAKHVAEQIAYVKSQPNITGPKKVLIIGASTGYGLATRIAAAYGCGASTLGVSYEHPASGSRTASAGWYNTAEFERQAQADGLYAKDIIGDAFSLETKEKTAALIKKELGSVDMVVYSLAAPRRTDHAGVTYSSVIKPIGQAYSGKTINMKSRTLGVATAEPATQEEIENTVKVMGGEDWKLWIEFLSSAGVLADGVQTLAYSYIGPEVTHAIYTDGTIGRAKQDVERTAKELNAILSPLHGQAIVSVNKAVVTQASAAIPAVPLYTTLLFKIMKQKGLHEDCIRQMYRMFAQKLTSPAVTDREGRLRLDDWELRDEVQQEVTRLWDAVDDTSLPDFADLDGYWNDFLQLFGFGLEDVDYDADVETEIGMPGLVE